MTSKLLPTSAAAALAAAALAAGPAAAQGATAANPVVEWNRTPLYMVRTPGAQPATVHPARSFALLHAAMYDAVVSIDNSAPAYRVSRRATARAAAAGTVVGLKRTKVGVVLVDSRGRTLYDFVKDRGGVSACYGACAALWPPLITKGRPSAGRGVRARLLGTTRRNDGTLEVTYNRHPLYYYVADRKPGQLAGQGLPQFGAPWWALDSAGREVHRRG